MSKAQQKSAVKRAMKAARKATKNARAYVEYVLDEVEAAGVCLREVREFLIDAHKGNLRETFHQYLG